MSLQVVKLFGYATFIYKPSEESLVTPIDITTIYGQDYFNLIEQLQEILLRMDEDYALRSPRRKRSIIVKNERIRNERRRILYLTPFPSSVSSVFKNLRAEIANFLLYNGIKLETDPYIKRVIYLIPQSRLNLLAEEIEKWNKKIIFARETINKVSNSHYFEELEILFLRYKLDIRLKIPEIRDVMVDIYPLTLEVDTNIPTALQNVILRTRRLYLSNVLLSIYERAKHELQSGKPNPERINSLIELADEFGLVSIASELRENIKITNIANSINYLNVRTEVIKKELMK